MSKKKIKTVFNILVVLSLVSFITYKIINFGYLPLHSVSGEPYFMNRESSVKIIAGDYPDNIISIVLYRKNIKEGYTVESNKNDKKEIRADAIWDKEDYILTKKEDTRIRVKIVKLDKKNREAFIIFYAHFLNPSSGKYLKFKKYGIVIKDKNFNNLMIRF